VSKVAHVLADIHRRRSSNISKGIVLDVQADSRHHACPTAAASPWHHRR
jgi:pSer/pThr/pTyr-binding forkhead associated (FHA) protein